MNKLEALRCVEVTSQQQADNGTVCYYDPVTKVNYMSYESGYIRRSYKTKSWRSNKDIETIYQLNPKRRTKRFSAYIGTTFEYTERIMITDPEERMDRLANAVINYRNTLKNRKG